MFGKKTNPTIKSIDKNIRKKMKKLTPEQRIQVALGTFGAGVITGHVLTRVRYEGKLNELNAQFTEQFDNLFERINALEGNQSDQPETSETDEEDEDESSDQ